MNDLVSPLTNGKARLLFIETDGMDVETQMAYAWMATQDNLPSYPGIDQEIATTVYDPTAHAYIEAHLPK